MSHVFPPGERPSRCRKEREQKHSSRNWHSTLVKPWAGRHGRSSGYEWRKVIREPRRGGFGMSWEIVWTLSHKKMGSQIKIIMKQFPSSVFSFWAGKLFHHPCPDHSHCQEEEKQHQNPLVQKACVCEAACYREFTYSAIHYLFLFQLFLSTYHVPGLMLGTWNCWGA